MKKIVIVRAIILLTSAFCFLGACKKPNHVDDETDSTRLHIVWSKPFLDENTFAVMQDPVIVDGYVLFAGYQESIGSALTNRINIFDKTNGEGHPHPAWGGGITDNLGHEIREILIGGSNNDIIFYSTSQSLQAFSIDFRQHLWTSVYDKSYNSFATGRISRLGTDIIIPNFGTSFIGEIHRYNFSTGQKTTLFSFDDVVKTIQWATNEQNDTLLFFSNGWKTVYCYNLTQDSIVWENTLNFDHSESTSHSPIILENKYVLFQHSYKISCVDFSTGKLIWDVVAISTGNCPILYYEGKVIVRPNYGNITCYDVRNGDLLWTSSDFKLSLNSSREYGKMDAYKGNLYFTTGGTWESSLYCISLSTGSVNWFDAGPTDRGIYGGLAIDQQTGYLYCHSLWSVMCVDLNKTPK